ncbi:MAG: ABC transporter permease [Bacteroidota bacterium]
MFKNHFKIALRSIFKRKTFTTINVLGLALGFGSSIIIYLFVLHHLSFDTFHSDSDRIYRVVTEERMDAIDFTAAVPPGFTNAFRANYGFSEAVSRRVFWEEQLINIGAQGSTLVQLRENISFVEAPFFSIFNYPLVSQLAGRTLEEPNTAYITEDAALRLFPDEDPLGKTFVLENIETVQVIGVLKTLPKTTFAKESLFLSFPTIRPYNQFLFSDTWAGIDSRLECYTKLRPNQSVAQIEDLLTALPKEHRPNSKNTHVYKLQVLSDVHLDHQYGGFDVQLLWIFSAIGFFLLAIACINFINIATAQGFKRSKEIGVRKVLGSLKTHLFWQFISETFVLSLLGLLLGALLAIVVLPYFNGLFQLELALQDALDMRFIMFLLGLLFLVSFFSGSYPGVLLARVLPVLAIKGKLNPNDTGGERTRKILVITQFVISIVLIVSTLIIGKQLHFATNSDLGFDKDAIIMVALPDNAETSDRETLRQRISTTAGVQQVTACLGSPGASPFGWGTSVQFDNRPEAEEFSIVAKSGDENYLDAFGLELIAGRNFVPRDSIDETLVNRTLVKKLGVDSPEAILGRTLHTNGGTIAVKIVGVVSDFHDNSFQEQISPIFIAPVTWSYYSLGIRMAPKNMAGTLKSLEKIYLDTFPGDTFDYDFMDAQVAEEYEAEQRLLTLSRVFSFLALFIGSLGLYGLIAFFVGQRIREIGIRKVLGSSVWQILQLFANDFIKLVGISGVVAIPIAWYLMENWLQNYAYRIPIDPWVFALALLSVLLLTLFIIVLQTVKSATTSPIKSLRTE